MKKKIMGVLAICVAAILWGLDGTLLTPRLYNLDVSFVVFMLHLIPFVIMNIFLFKEYKNLAKFSKADYIDFFLVALAGGVVGTLSIVKALFLVNFQQLSVVLLLQKLQPIFALILAYILLKEKLKKGFILWAGLAIIAGYFMSFGFNLPNFDSGLYASLYALLAAFSFGSATVLGKKVLMKYDFKTVSFYRFGFTSFIMLILVMITSKMGFSEVTSENWIIFFVVALLIGLGSTFIYYYGLTRVKASLSTILELVFPISVLIFDYVFNGNILSFVQFVAAAVMICSIIMITKQKTSSK